MRTFIPNGNTPYPALIISLESSAGEAALFSEDVKAVERSWHWGK